MKKPLHFFSLSLLALTLSACSSLDILPDTKKIDYKSAGKVPSLQVPPDLSQVARDERYAVPDSAGKGAATLSTYNADRTGAAKTEKSIVLPKVDNARIERVGSERWLVVAVPAGALWGTIKDFWQEIGFIVVTEIPEAGIMETDWAENRAKLPGDLIRNTLGKLLDSLYSTGERDKFRTRMEPGKEPGTTDIFISHRGMEEVYTTTAKNDTRWQPRPPNPELEAEMLRRLMVRLGTEEKRAETAIASAKIESRAKLTQSSDGTGTVEVQEGFDRAWRRVGLTLDRVGFTVEDRDRTKGIYFVRYVDPELDNKKESKGWLDKIAFWKGSGSTVSKEQYRIYVANNGGSSTVQVLTREGGVEKSDTARRILNLLYEQLK